MLLPKAWDGWAVGAIPMLEAGRRSVGTPLVEHSCWGLRHKLWLAQDASLAHAWHAFIKNPAIGEAGISVRVGNAFFAAGQVALIAFAAKRVFAPATVPRQGEEIELPKP